MKLAPITLTESAYTSLKDWEAAAKTNGFSITKDNKTGTYHAWDHTSHKGSFRAPIGKGELSEPKSSDLKLDELSQAARQRYIAAANRSRTLATDEYMRTGQLDSRTANKMGRRAEITMKAANKQSKVENTAVGETTDCFTDLINIAAKL